MLQGTVADRLIGESAKADLLVFGPGAARRFDDPAWAQIWARVTCPITIARGRMRIPDRRPVLLAVDQLPHAASRTNDEAVHEADLRDVGLFALVSGPTVVSEPRLGPAQLVVADLPRHLAGEVGARDDTLRWLVSQTLECPLLLVPAAREA